MSAGGDVDLFRYIALQDSDDLRKQHMGGSLAFRLGHVTFDERASQVEYKLLDSALGAKLRESRFTDRARPAERLLSNVCR